MIKCQNAHGKHSKCVNMIGSFNCECKDNFDMDENGTCVDVNECLTDDHGCDVEASCTNKIGYYECNCNDGYEGDGFNCIDIDECAGENDCSGSVEIS